MSLLRQLLALKNQYLTANAEHLRTAIYINGGIPLEADPAKATRKHLIPHFVIYWGLPPTADEPDAGLNAPDGRAAYEDSVWTRSGQAPALEEDVIA
jgi:hypothetical protein